MAPSFISMLMGATDKRATPTDTRIGPAQSSNAVLPHLGRGRSGRADSVPFLQGFQRPLFDQPQAVAPQVRTTVHWNDKQKVQDFFRHTRRSGRRKGTGIGTCAKAVPTDYYAIDLERHSVPDSRASSVTSFSSSVDNQDELYGVQPSRGRLQSALEELQASQQANDEQNERTDPTVALPNRRRYDSFDILADVRLSEEIEATDGDSVDSTPARSRANSEDFYGIGLLDLLSQRHMPVGLHRHASVADMLGNCVRAPVRPEEDDDERDRERPALCGPEDLLETHTRSPELSRQRFVADASPRPSATLTNALASPLSQIHSEAMAPTLPSSPPPQHRTQTSTSNDPTPVRDHPTYQKYFQMLKVGLPVAVVKHKMQSDGVDPSILDLDPTLPLPLRPARSHDESDVIYQTQLQAYEATHGKYVQMLKVGLPQAVVEHKMRTDGIDPAWLHGPPQRSETTTQALEVSDDARAAHRRKYHKYFQMLRLGLPRGAVEQKMRMAGVDPIELNGPHPRRDAPPPPKVLKRKDSIRKKLHWEGKKHRRRRDSLWGGDAGDEAKEAVQISDESRAMLEHLFVKDLSESTPRSSKREAETRGKTPKLQTQLLDLKKAQNIAITLARVKVTFNELKHALLAMDPSVLSPSQVRSLMDMWPDRNEMQAIQAFHGDVATIGTAEQFLVEVRQIPRFQEKLGCLVVTQEFPSRVHELRTALDVVIQGVTQVCASTELRQVFIYILQIGNLLNFGGDQDQGVDAFSLGSLVKLSQTKAFVGGITFLQYVVQSIERDMPHLAHFYQEIDLIATCSKVAYASLEAEKKALEAGLQKLQREADASALDETTQGFRDAVLRNWRDATSELATLQSRFDELKAAKARFLEYFEEEETEEELDTLLSYISTFTNEYCRERGKYLAQRKTERATKGSERVRV